MPFFRLSTLFLILPFLLVACDNKPSVESQQDNEIANIISTMTLEQKVAQMIQAEIRHITPEDVRKWGVGSILNGGGSFPNNNKSSSIQDWQNLAQEFRDASLDTSMGSAGIPIIWGTDAVHGHNNVVGATLFPHNIGLGAAHDEELIFRIGQATAKEVAATGIDWIFAPTVAVVKDDRWGRTYESYSENSELVGSYATQIVKGLQSINLGATVKHFIGDGASFRGDDQGNILLPLDDLITEHGAGYVSAIDQGVQSVMAAFNSHLGQKIHGNKTLLTDVLRGRLGFDGVIVTDWNGHGQVAGCTNESCAQAINAGVDLVMVTEDWKAFHTNLVQQVKDGIVPISRIDDAVARILKMKLSLGLFSKDFSVNRQPVEVIGSAEHRAIAREAVRKSLVLLKNNNDVLPLNPTQKVLVLGEAADNIGQQSGGWTITWQGTGNNNADFPGGTSVYQGIADEVNKAEGVVALNHWQDMTTKPDVVVWVFGETPYAEGVGDIEHLDFVQPNNNELETVRHFKAQGVPVVAVFLSGRPMWVNEELNAVDAFVAAWLPGTEGEGIADVLFTDNHGEINYDFTGRLSFGWPALPINIIDADQPVDDILFAPGYGLSYQNKQTFLDILPENIDGFSVAEDYLIFNRGNRAPWQLALGNSGYITALPYKTVDNSLLIKALDIQVQEDGLMFEFDQASDISISWQSDISQDLNDLFNDAMYLQLQLMFDGVPDNATLKIACETDCRNIDITSVIAKMEPNNWQTLAIDSSCFATDGDLRSVKKMLELVVSGSTALSLQDIRLTPVVSVDALSCQ